MLSEAIKKAPMNNSSADAEAAIRLQIVEGRLVPGQRLVEIDLMRELDVSRGQIREIFRKLESDGIVRIEKNRGASVKKLSRQEFIDTIEVLGAVTILAVEKVARRADEPKVQRAIKRSLEVARKFEDELDQHTMVQDYMNENVRFWGCIGSLTGNKVLEDTRARMQFPLLRLHTQSLLLKTSKTDWIFKHPELLQAILDSDVKKAIKLTSMAQKGVWKAMSSLPDSAFV